MVPENSAKATNQEHRTSRFGSLLASSGVLILQRGTAIPLLAAEQFTRAGAGLIVTLIIARTLDPANFGYWSYAAALHGALLLFATAGINSYVVVEAARLGNNAGGFLGSALRLRIIFAALTSLLAVILIVTRQLPGDVAVAFAILFASLWVQPLEVYEQALLAHGKMAVVVSARLSGLSVSIALRLLACLLLPTLWLLAIALLAEYALTFGLLRLAYRQRSSPLPRASNDILSTIWRHAALLFPATAGVALLQKLDQILLGSLRPAHELAMFAPAVLASDACALIGAAVFVGALSELTQLFQHDARRFLQVYEKLWMCLVLAGGALLVLLPPLAEVLIVTAFGETYRGASVLLQIRILAVPLVFLHLVLTWWNYVRKDYRTETLRCVAGATVALALGISLIPQHGAVGAAWTSVAAWSVCSGLGIALARERALLLAALSRGLLLIPLWAALPRLRRGGR